ncbi:MAG: hypothetical protein JRF33_04685 [Deltaproteobacteria bacterium]|nr:hypothetical protein [Deltaproteobacteria bacterium]
MPNEKFQVQPLKSYKGAIYPGATTAIQEEESPGKNFWKFLFCLMLVMGLSMGLIGCFSDYKIDQCPSDSTPVNGKCVGPDDNCEPDQMRCDTEALMICDEDGEGWTGQNCDGFCQDMYGMDAWSEGCDTNAQDPCQCEYDIMLGVMAECTPGDIHCLNDDTLQVCDENAWSFTDHDCQDWCVENYGRSSLAGTCDASETDNPCGCEYGIVDGEPVP